VLPALDEKWRHTTSRINIDRTMRLLAVAALTIPAGLVPF